MDEHYTSTGAFERFAKLTAIGILALTIMRKASRETYPSEYVAPWAALAKRLGFDKLAVAILEAEPQRWRAEKRSGLSGGWLDDMEERIQSWFTERVEPLLQAQRELAVRKAPKGSQASAPRHQTAAPANRR